MSGAARAALGLYQSYPKLARTLATMAREKAQRFFTILEKHDINFSSIKFLLDVSGSMMRSHILAGARILLALGASRTYVFSGLIIPPSEIVLEDIEDYEMLFNIVGGSTPLYDALA